MNAVDSGTMTDTPTPPPIPDAERQALHAIADAVEAILLGLYEPTGTNSHGKSAWHFVERMRAALAFESAVPSVEIAALTPSEPQDKPSYQHRVMAWLMECFGHGITNDRVERVHRFWEEALEIGQSAGCTAVEAHQLVDYVFGRPTGELHQEIGGTLVCLAALCAVHDIDMDAEGERELARVWTKVEKIRAKHAAKPSFSPLPGPSEAEAQPTPPRLTAQIGPDDTIARGCG